MRFLLILPVFMTATQNAVPAAPESLSPATVGETLRCVALGLRDSLHPRLLLGRVVTCFTTAFGAVRDAAPGAGRAAVWIPQAASDAARRPKCTEPAGLGRKNTIHCVARLANNRLLAASRA
ncbi:hypothetical protein [Chitiniphilus eburneus]|uniref:hypothetical protein n=1 Tax=Chitiniphilus eburneus TaxID=2571148 RepID=UPI0035CF27C9